MKYIIFALISLFLFAGCENEDEDGNETQISRNNSDESHNIGENCMSCHVQGGEGEGWFTLAGSVYDDTQTNVFTNGNVKLTTEPDGLGTTVKTIEIDRYGNFYTTESIDFGSGLYVGVYGDNGENRFMNSKIITGACNSCHGNTISEIRLD